MMQRGEIKLAEASTVQLLKAIHQCALDRGSWGTASMLLVTADPNENAKFAGSSREMELIHRHMKATEELTKSHHRINFRTHNLNDDAWD